MYDHNEQKYQITQGDHSSSSFYNHRREVLLDSIGQSKRRNDLGIDLTLGRKPIAIEKTLDNSQNGEPISRVINTETLKKRALKEFEDDTVI